MEPLKSCPYCKIVMRRGEDAGCLVKLKESGMASSPGLPVTYLWCPACGYIELYSLRVVGRV